MNALWDNHMHCNFSGDCTAPAEDMIDAAQKCGLRGITFTDHLDLDYQEHPGLFDLDLPNYETQILALSQRFHTPSFTILFGIELGLQPHLAAVHETLVQTYPFDYVIGSSHVVCGMDPYYPAFFDGREKAQGYTDYYLSLLENIRAFDGFDSYGHLDYIFRYGPDSNLQPDTYSDHADLVDAILLELIRRDKALEVNTGGYRCGLGQTNPGPAILRRYRELGGTLITLGADAHHPEHVALRFDLLPSFLRSLGFKEYAVYQQRRPVFYPLPDL